MKFWNENCAKSDEMENIKRNLNKQISTKEKQIENLQKKVEDI